MARIIIYGPTADTEQESRYSAGESNTGLPEDYSVHSRRMNASGPVMYDFRFDVSGRGTVSSPEHADVYIRLWIRVVALPSTEAGICLDRAAPIGAAGTIITLDEFGVLRLRYMGGAAFPGTLAGAFGTVTVGTWHKIILRTQRSVQNFPPPASNYQFVWTGSANLDGGAFTSGTVNTAGAFLGATFRCYQFRLGREQTATTNMSIDVAHVVGDSTATPVDSRITAVRVAAVGTYQEWAVSGLPNWQARNCWPANTASTAPIKTTTAGQKQTYLMESYATAGITGTILSAVVHAYNAHVSATTPTLIVIRNGVETPTVTYAAAAAQYMTYRLDTTGWLVTDTLELGLEATAPGTTILGPLLLAVEHTTLVPAITLGDIDSDEVSWVGNDTAQDVTLPFADPQMILWQRRVGTTSGGIWLAEANVNHNWAGLNTGNRPALRVRGTTMTLVHEGASGPNAAGVQYDALVIRDPKMRMLCAGGFAATTGAIDDGIAIATLDPATAVFVPLCVYATQETQNTNVASTYYGPGNVGDAALNFMQTGTLSDRIQSLTATGFTSGTTLNQDQQQVNYAAFRRTAVNVRYLMDAVSYIGDGGATKVVSVDLSAGTVKWAFGWDFAGVASSLTRNSHQTSGYPLSSGAAPADQGFTALGVDSVTVALSRNASGRKYALLVFGYGNDPAPAPISIVECLHGSSVALLELSGSHTETFKARGSYRDTLTLEAGYLATLTSTGSHKSAITGLKGSL